MSATQPTSREELKAMLSAAAQTPSQAAAIADMLPGMVRNLPPEHSQLASRTKFALGTDSMLQASWQDVRIAQGATAGHPQIIQVPYDCWIRGAVGYASLFAPGQINDPPTVDQFTEAREVLKSLTNRRGSCGRWLFDVNWRINGKQGFVGRGDTEVLAQGNLVLGTGKYPAALDWNLQKGQTISVRIRSNAAFMNTPGGPFDQFPPLLGLVVVGFYALQRPASANVPITAWKG